MITPFDLFPVYSSFIIFLSLVIILPTKYFAFKKDKNTRSGSIAFIQIFGRALNLNIHLHMLQIEGCYHKKTTGCHKFKKHRSPQDSDILKLVNKIRKRVINLLIRLGYLQIHEYEQPEACNDTLFA